MKPLTCELCSGIDLVKQDGVYICQHCGAKYSVEDAKRMMIEGTVDVQGTVKVDNSSLVQKSLANARRAKQKEDWEETERYYNIVEQNDPDNIEAIFYSAFAKAKGSLTSDDIYKRQAIFKVLVNSISILDDNFKKEEAEANIKTIQEITNDICALCKSSFVFTQTKTQYGTSDNKYETTKLFKQVANEYIASLWNIINMYELSDRQEIVPVIECAIAVYSLLRDSLSLSGALGQDERNKCNQQIVVLHTMIHEVDPAHEIPTYEEEKTSTAKTLLGCGLIIVAGIVLGVLAYNFFYALFW